jgi:hypothetical protein
MWTWEVVLSLALVLVGLGVMAGQGFEFSWWVAAFWIPAVLLLFVKLLHREPRKEDDADGRRVEHTFRAKFSSEQILEHKMSKTTGPIRDVDSLNLDNVATLHMGMLGNLEGVDLYMVQSSPLFVEQPLGDQKYPTGSGLTTQFPGADLPGMEMRRAKMVDLTGAREFKFRKEGAGRTHVIVLDPRRFSVVLDEIRDLSELPDLRHIQWVFRISEL